MECAKVKNLLTVYEQGLGWAVNYKKSGIFFSLNVRDDNKSTLSSISGVHLSLQHQHYLGMLFIIGKRKK